MKPSAPSNHNEASRGQFFLPILSLFASTSTLLCCALPALLVSIGAGATLAGIVSSAPWLISITKYKAWTFGVSGLLILMAGAMRYLTRNAACPIDRAQAQACGRLNKWTATIYWLSVVIWVIGFFFAFLAIYLI